MFIRSAMSSVTRFTTNSLVSRMFLAVSFGRPCREPTETARTMGALDTPIAKEKGAQLSTPSGLLVDTKAMGRGTNALIMRRYASSSSKVSGSTIMVLGTRMAGTGITFARDPRVYPPARPRTSRCGPLRRRTPSSSMGTAACAGPSPGPRRRSTSAGWSERGPSRSRRISSALAWATRSSMRCGSSDPTAGWPPAETPCPSCSRGCGAGPLRPHLRRRVRRDEGAERLQVLPIPSVRPRVLQAARDHSEPSVVHEEREEVGPDPALADVLVPVEVAPEVPLGVVQVERPDPPQADRRVDPPEEVLVPVPRADVVPRCERVARVHAHPEAIRVGGRLNDVRELLAGVPQ